MIANSNNNNGAAAGVSNQPASSAPLPPAHETLSSTHDNNISLKKTSTGTISNNISTLNSKSKELKKRILEAEQDNEKLLLRIGRVRRNIYRLRLERKFLLEKTGNKSSGGGRAQNNSHQAASTLQSPQAKAFSTAVAAATANAPQTNTAMPSTPSIISNASLLEMQGAWQIYLQSMQAQNSNILKSVIEAQWKSLPDLEKQKYLLAYRNGGSSGASWSPFE